MGILPLNVVDAILAEITAMTMPVLALPVCVNARAKAC
ncbi:hypothetical protein IMCC12053_2537 [Celeribacter marinus]|uniref:Uncharacterized protein n=1 Tax=Celeribacter marinus TaxID=1397108 RepID=A0A0P0ADE5_9RHOB|nr:hypothetical protein IMCC12053_2537 [Celeribacter marinus]